MAEVILVVLWRPAVVATLLNAARHLAGLSGGVRINALAVSQPVGMSGFAGEALMSEVDRLLAARQQEQERVAALRAAFDRWLAAAGEAAAAAHWIAAEGDAAAVVGERGSRADWVVAERPAEDDRRAGQNFRAAVFGTDRPVLMVPAGAPATFGRRVAIAWRDEKRAARAVLPVLRWLAAAEQVHVLIGLGDGAPPPVMPRILLEHGIRAELHGLRLGAGPFGQLLLDTAHALGADLLVMGAYAHSPLRELVLGGVTRHMLAHADLPVLMRH